MSTMSKEDKQKLIKAAGNDGVLNSKEYISILPEEERQKVRTMCATTLDKTSGYHEKSNQISSLFVNQSANQEFAENNVPVTANLNLEEICDSLSPERTPPIKKDGSQSPIK